MSLCMECPMRPLKYIEGIRKKLKEIEPVCKFINKKREIESNEMFQSEIIFGSIFTKAD